MIMPCSFSFTYTCSFCVTSNAENAKATALLHTKSFLLFYEWAFVAEEWIKSFCASRTFSLSRFVFVVNLNANLIFFLLALYPLSISSLEKKSGQRIDERTFLPQSISSSIVTIMKKKNCNLKGIFCEDYKKL